MAKKVKQIRVYNVNDEMVVANTIEQAIATYKQEYADSEVRKVEQICCGDKYLQESYNALIVIDDE